MFKLTIELGNEAMQTPEDVAEALQAVARELERLSGSWPRAGAEGKIRDVNGNTVGKWES
jgi:hypothetical protein